MKNMRVKFKQIFCVILAAVCLLGNFVPNIKVHAETGISAEETQRQGRDVVFVIDNSRSIWAMQDVRNQAFRKIANLAVGSDIRIGIVYFAGDIYKKLALTPMSDPEGSKKVLDFLNMTDQNPENINTNIGKALDEAGQMLDGQDPNRSQSIILFSDGINEKLNDTEGYKEQADAQTYEEMQELKSENVPVYCVYLQKNRNDEGYLKDLVNYFDPAGPDHTAERFVKVREDEIARLSEVFTDIFYKMQKNMRYHKINLDSNGKLNFYVPSLGINRMQVYLDGQIEEGTLNPAGPSECTDWKDGSSRFLIYKNPVPGEWSMEVKSPDQDHIQGIIAYYTDIRMQPELTRLDTKDYQLTLHFYDETGSEITMDPKIQVEASLIFESDGEIMAEYPAAMTIQDGLAVSDTLTLETYGPYTLQVHIGYDDLIDLHYTDGSGEMTKTAPEVYNRKHEVFEAEKKDGAYTFVIEASHLYKDPEGDVVTITEWQPSGSEGQPDIVGIHQEDGKIYMTASEKGKVEGKLQLMDASGMTAEVSIKGKVVNGKIHKMIQMVLRSAVLGLILGVIITIFKSKRDKKVIAECLKGTPEVLTNIQEIMEQVQEEKARADQELQYIQDPDMFKKLGYESEMLSEDEQKIFHVEKFFRPDFLQKKYVLFEAEKSEIQAQYEELSRGYMSGDECKKKIEKIWNQIEVMKQHFQIFKEENVAMMEQISQVLDEREEQIRLDVQISNIEQDPYVSGLKSCRDDMGNYRVGGIELDTIYILGRDRLSQIIGQTGMYIYGGKDDLGKPVLKLRSAKDFSWIKEGKSDMQKGNMLTIHANETFRLTFCTHLGKTALDIHAGL